MHCFAHEVTLRNLEMVFLFGKNSLFSINQKGINPYKLSNLSTEDKDG